MLRERMGALGRHDEYECPELPASPRAAADLLVRLTSTVAVPSLSLIGSSRGGYYATWLAERLGCRAVLLNPAVTPARDLAAHLGRQPVFFSHHEIDFRPEYLRELEELDTPAITHPQRYLLLAATGDAVIDYRAMTSKYIGARQHVIDGSDHELSDFGQYMEEVLAFCGLEHDKGDQR
jgi:predicted esterase YcpF (UPF0227 family)